MIQPRGSMMVANHGSKSRWNSPRHQVAKRSGGGPGGSTVPISGRERSARLSRTGPTPTRIVSRAGSPRASSIRASSSRRIIGSAQQGAGVVIMTPIASEAKVEEGVERDGDGFADRKEQETHDGQHGQGCPDRSGDHRLVQSLDP